MPGPWKAWKTKPRFSTLPTAPWKSPTARFPHSHSSYDEPLFSQTNKNQRAVEKWKSQTAGFPLSHRPEATWEVRLRQLPSWFARLPGAYGSVRHPRKERTLGPPEASAFMLISHWNRFWISCSSLDWKMLRTSASVSASIYKGALN